MLERPRIKPTILRDQSRVRPGVWSQIERAIDAQSFPIVLIGPAGTGKTCAALCVADLFGSGRYRTVADMNDQIIAAQQGELWDGSFRVTPSAWWRDWVDARLCILDELGARARVSDAHYENVKRAIDARHGLALIVISNVDMSNIERLYDDRIASRLSAGTVIVFKGDDRRLSRDEAATVGGAA